MGFTRWCAHLVMQSPWCWGPEHPPHYWGLRRGGCSNHGAPWPGAAVDGGCARGLAPCAGGASEPGPARWSPAWTGNAAAAAGGVAGGGGGTAGRGWPSPAAARGWWDRTPAAGSSPAPYSSVCSSPAGLWSACPARLMEARYKKQRG